MYFKKRLNNNVVIAVTEHGDERILCGRGLGFKMVPGAFVAPERVEKVFTLKDKTANRRLLELVETVPVEYVELAEQIVNRARACISNPIEDNAVVSLSDHIYMAVQRAEQGIEVKNVMLWDIRKFYPQEYRAGLDALDLIAERTGAHLADDEAGFIALHLVNAQLDLHAKSIEDITAVMQEIETIVRMSFAISIDPESVYYYRFITHLKFFAQRLFSGTTYEERDVSVMLEVVRGQYPAARGCVDKIRAFLRQKYGYVMSDEEELYLTIHISRIAQASGEGKEGSAAPAASGPASR